MRKSRLFLSLLLTATLVVGALSSTMFANEDIEDKTIDKVEISENLNEDKTTTNQNEDKNDSTIQNQDTNEDKGSAIKAGTDSGSEGPEVESEKVVVDELLNTKSLGIQTTEQLETAILNANDGDTILIDGGSIIDLNKTLTIDSAKLQNLTIASSDDNAVILNNASNTRHFKLVGSNNLNLYFKGITLSGTQDSLGGIETTTVKGLNIDGLNIQNNHIVTKTMYDGFILYKSTGSFTLSNTTILSNTLTDKASQSSYIVSIDTSNASVSFDNVTIDNVQLKPLYGSTIYVYGDNNIVTATQFNVSNSTTKQGSTGLFVSARKNTSLSVDSSSFRNNTTQSSTYGAIHFEPKAIGTSLKVTNSTFDSNYADRGGAAISILSSSDTDVVIDGSTFTNNKVGRIQYNSDTGNQSGLPGNGGAILFEQRSADAKLLVSNSSFINNEATEGGAINIQTSMGYVNTTIEDSILDHNTADYSGGAIHFSYSKSEEINGAFTLNNTELTNNISTGRDTGPGWYPGGYGGAITFYALENYPTLLKTNDVTFSGNQSAEQNYWNFRGDNSGAIDNAYRDNILNTTCTEVGPDPRIPTRNNIFNGDDVYFELSAYMILDTNPDNIEDLIVKNYDADASYYFQTYKGTHFPQLLEPQADGYRFLGWIDQNGVAWNFDEDTLVPGAENGWYYLQAKWEAIKTFEIKYTDGVDGEVIFEDQTYTVEDGEATPAYVGDTPKREGYTFNGWDPIVSESVSKDVVYTAQWEAIPKFIITYTDGVNNETIFEDQIYTAEEGSKTPEYIGVPTRSGYTFAGWKPEVSEFVSENKTYIAQWEAIPKFIVTYTDGVNNETIFEDQIYTVEEGSKTPEYIGVPTRSGYTFAGWSPEITEFVSVDKTYTAQWEKVISKTGSVIIRYVDTDGNAIMDPDTITGTVGSAYTLSPKAIEGYNFVEFKQVSLSRVMSGFFTESEIEVHAVYTKLETINPKPNTNTPSVDSKETSDKSSPTTGINTNTVLYLSCAGIAMTTIIAAYFYKRRHTN